ncbi:hypothetical protein QFC19_008440 [Naganishia cerealis]|uniref:Uncharacterized protein n=1 Tax=Naganishia cerealis TaxID=610337 RepID=A0ACC2V1L4_9TREE|nr:hypothetical protein QFC19_008440 [Naganishia cerealis]
MLFLRTPIPYLSRTQTPRLVCRTIMSTPYHTVSTDREPALSRPSTSVSPADPWYDRIRSPQRLPQLSDLTASIPLNPETMKVVDGGIEEQTAQMFKNVKGVMNAAGTDTSRVLKTTASPSF